MGKIKVVFLIQGLDYSGAEIVLDRFLNNNEFVDPYFILLFDNEEVYSHYEEIYDNVLSMNMNKWLFVNKIFPGLLSYIFYFKSKEYLKNIKPDVIYANNTTESIILGFKSNNMCIPSIAHIHDMVDDIRNPLRRWCLDYSLEKNINSIITVSKAAKKQMNINKNINIIYNGLDDNYFSNDYQKTNNIFKIGFVGSLIKRKGADILIESLEYVNYDIQCNIVYNYKNEKYYNKILSLINNSNSNIQLFNNFSRKEVENFYKQIDLLIVPSRNDPLPTVIMEAMAKSTLVIGSNIDGIPEMLDNDELLFEKNSLLSLSKKINYIIKLDKKKKRYIEKKQFLRAKKLFADKEKTNKVNDILKSLI